MLNEDIMKKAHGAKSPEELIKLGEEAGITLSKESAERYFSSMHSSGELSDEELASASAGCGGYAASINKTCPWCGGNIPMSDISCVRIYSPKSYDPSKFDDFLYDYPSGVCQKCGRRYIYIHQYGTCVYVTEEGGELVARVDHPM